MSVDIGSLGLKVLNHTSGHRQSELCAVQTCLNCSGRVV